MLGLPAGWHRRAAAVSRGLPRAAHSPVLAVCRMAPPCRGRKPWPASRSACPRPGCLPDGAAVPRLEAVGGSISSEGSCPRQFAG